MNVLLAAGTSVDFGSVLLDLAVILLVAKIAAEVAERFRIPAVLGEILAGILVGPSVLSLVTPTDSLRVLAEIGVILLLATVGLETDLNELRQVGRSSLSVAVVGVALPMATGVGAGLVLGEPAYASLFLGAALAATSVGITARVFGDLRALSSVEARIVLGAAVADDVLGLVILTVVTRIVQQGSVDVIAIAGTIGLAVGFLVASLAVGLLVVPRMFRAIGNRATSAATIGVVAAGTTFAFAAAADAAHLAPIIGAFVAGASLGRTDHHDRISRDLGGLANVLVPVFFLMIGVETEVGKFFQSHVLLVATVLSVVAVVGKVLSGFVATGPNIDRLLIGLGMVPRGEVGLIFATIGMSVGVFHEDLYAVVLLVVLVTTLVSPPLLRARISRAAVPAPSADDPEVTREPAGGWAARRDDGIHILGTPSSRDTLKVALDVALLASSASVSTDAMEWLHSHRGMDLSWDDNTTRRLLVLLFEAGPRSWRLLELTGVLERSLPEFARSIEARQSDSTELDPTHTMSLPTVEAIRSRFTDPRMKDESLVLAAFLSDICTNGAAPMGILDRLHLTESLRAEVSALVAASSLLEAIAKSEPYDNSPRVMAQLAEYLGNPTAVERCRILTESRVPFNDRQYPRLIDITTGVQALLAHPELIEGQESSLEGVRRREAIELAPNEFVRDRIAHADAGYVISHDPETIVRHATLVEPAPRGRNVRVNVLDGSTGLWVVEIATRDARGLLARIAGVLADNGLEIVTADLATWPDGAVVDTFTVRSPHRPSATQISFHLSQSLRRRVPMPRRLQFGISNGLVVSLDNNAHPWHSVVTVTGADQPGLLQSLAAAFARAGVTVLHARISTENSVVTDKFEVSDRHGRKISSSHLARIESSIS